LPFCPAGGKRQADFYLALTLNSLRASARWAKPSGFENVTALAKTILPLLLTNALIRSYFCKGNDRI